MTEHLSELNIAGYVDGTLTPGERAAVERHIAACDNCRLEVVEVSQLTRAPRRIGRYFIPVAAAAVIALVMLNVKQPLKRDRPILRGAAVASALIMITPSNNEIVSTTPTLVWRSVADAGQYRVTITSDSGNVVLEKLTPDTTTSVSPLVTATAFHWYVTAIKLDGSSESSAVRSFRTQ